ncbi:hypothetical protein [Azospirillum sp.]|uniref:hypothetical protein n=1 Tax=Azospirillum sp. TaxID=34012 RepID=UPI003D723735
MRHAPTAKTKHPAIVRRMADAIVQATEGRGSCSIADLRNAGFTTDEITQHGEAARDAAAERLRHFAEAA